MASLETGGYPLVVLLMAMESSIIPLPSEVVIPPAAHLAAAPGGMHPVGVGIAGTLGSWLGATVMYWMARWAGRPMILRYGRYILIPPEKVRGAERWAERFGSMGIFISRLLPVVRHLIGIPAGIVRMNYRLFSIYTLAGSAIWCAVLCVVGIQAGQNEELMAGEVHALSLWVGGAMVVLGGIYYFFVHRQMRETKGASGPEDDPPRG